MDPCSSNLCCSRAKYICQVSPLWSYCFFLSTFHLEASPQIQPLFKMGKYQHSISFRLCWFSLIYLSNVMWFSVYMSCMSFVKLIPEYFIFYTLTNSLFLIYFCLLLAYENTICFGILIIYPAILLNVFISSCNFLCKFLMLFCIDDHTVCKSRQFSSTIPIYIDMTLF